VDENVAIDQEEPGGHTDHEELMVYRDVGVSDADMDLLLELAFIATMSMNGDHAPVLADMLEEIHPYHAGAFIVRGLRAQSTGDLATAAQMYMIGMQADLKANEAAVLCLDMLKKFSLTDIDLATSIRQMLMQSETGRNYLEKHDQPTSDERDA